MPDQTNGTLFGLYDIGKDINNGVRRIFGRGTFSGVGGDVCGDFEIVMIEKLEVKLVLGMASVSVNISTLEPM